MNVDDIRAFCLSFPHVTENVQWGEDLCFKVAKKIFAIVDLGSVPPHICFKCTPEKFAELCEIDGIGPAPYGAATSGCWWNDWMRSAKTRCGT